MRQKLLELAEILKTNSAIKERLEELSFGCWVETQYGDKILIENERDFIYNNGGPDYNYLILLDESIDISYTNIIGHTPQFSDVLEFLGEDYLVCIEALQHKINLNHSNPYSAEWIALSPGPLSSQSDETLDEIILLCKSNVGTNNK